MASLLIDDFVVKTLSYSATVDGDPVEVLEELYDGEGQPYLVGWSLSFCYVPPAVDEGFGVGAVTEISLVRDHVGHKNSCVKTILHANKGEVLTAYERFGICEWVPLIESQQYGRRWESLYVSIAPVTFGTISVVQFHYAIPRLYSGHCG